ILRWITLLEAGNSPISSRTVNYLNKLVDYSSRSGELSYCTKQQFTTYLDAYAKHFSIQPIFGHEVKSANYNASTRFWRVVANGSEYFFSGLIKATRDNATPAAPDFDGLSFFGGKVMHSSNYNNGAEFRGRKVLVVNSCMEMSLNLCHNGFKFL
ncbi:indole-3-pyruvate monooxygenase YUCCA6, partial [Tanacetum coccineum]